MYRMALFDLGIFQYLFELRMIMILVVQHFKRIIFDTVLVCFNRSYGSVHTRIFFLLCGRNVLTLKVLHF